MSSRNPTYITKSRHGIWYFQYWVPNITNQNEKNVQKLIRRSLKTRNRREALGLARRWWIIMIESDANPNSIPDDLEKWEQDSEMEKSKYQLGAKVSHEMKKLGVDPDNPHSLDSYFECLPPRHEEAYWFYENERIFLRNTKNEGVEPRNQSLSVEEIASEVAKKIKFEGEFSDAENPTLEFLLESWLIKAKKRMRPSSYPEYERMTLFFSRILTGLNENESPRINSVNVQMVRRYMEIVEKVPKRVKTKELSLDQILNLKDGEPKRPTTLNHIFSNVGTFLADMEKAKYPIDAQVISLLQTKRTVKKRDQMQRVIFDDADLKNLFESQQYRQGKFRKACDYWAPLISLFTGAAESEIVQLYISDLCEQEGIPCININENGDKQLKNTDGRPRIVPIHPQLIKLGMLEYSEYQKSHGNKRLFPDEQRTGRYLFGKYSKRFCYYRDKVKAGPRNENELRDFHSFRHLVRTRLAKVRVESVIAYGIGGWTDKGRSVADKNYLHDEELVVVKFNAIKKLKYDLDFTLIRIWKYQAFMSIPEQFRDWDKK